MNISRSKDTTHAHLNPHPHSFAPAFFILSFSRSLIIRLKIFPLGLFGTISINSTPPLNHL